MRRPAKRKKHSSHFWIVAFLLFSVVAIGFCFDQYVNEKIRPTLMELAEYEARSKTLQTIHAAIARVMEDQPDLYSGLYTTTSTGIQLNASQANAARSALVQAVQADMEQLPEETLSIPFGSLTGNSLLSGHGPAWIIALQPEGYVQATWQESTESVSINTVRYSAMLDISVTVNMILDGRTETLTVRDQIALASVLISGQIPSVYAITTD